MSRSLSFIIIALLFTAIASLGFAEDPPLTINAGAAWNNHAASYNFEEYPTLPGVTFQEAYFGDDLSADLDAIITAVSLELMTTKPPVTDGGGVLNYTLENWPAN